MTEYEKMSKEIITAGYNLENFQIRSFVDNLKMAFKSMQNEWSQMYSILKEPYLGLGLWRKNGFSCIKCMFLVKENFFRVERDQIIAGLHYCLDAKCSYKANSWRPFSKRVTIFLHISSKYLINGIYPIFHSL